MPNDSIIQTMLIGQRLRRLRLAQDLSLGDIQVRVGLLRTYVSRVERGRTIPTLDTLEKLAFALRLPLYRLFVDGEQSKGNGAQTHPRQARANSSRHARANSSRHAREVRRYYRMLPRLCEADRDLLLATALQMARRHG